MTITHSALSDQVFEEQFENQTLNPTLFTHEAHLRLAFIHIKKYGIREAESNLSNQIRRFAMRHGEKEKFNKTVTVASLKVIHHFMRKSTADSFKQLLIEFPRLSTHFRELLEKHYGFDIFKNKKAKDIFIPPDLMPFDF